jgi:glycosyltransferase involved in cell wall biosynthesis
VRVALCLPAYEPAVEYGGPITKVRGLAQGLTKLGHDVVVWCADYGRDDSRMPAGHAVVNGVAVRYFERVASRRFLPIVRGVHREFAMARPDLVHCVGLRDGLTHAAARAAHAHAVPYIVEPAGMSVPRSRSVALKRVFDGTLGRGHIARAAVLIATSNLEASELHGTFPRARIEVRANPVELDANPVVPDAVLRSRLGIPPDAFVVASVARISTKKAFDVLVESITALPNVHVVIAGPDAGDGGMQSLTTAITRTRTGDRVHVVGPVWGRERDALVAACDAFALVSWSENFGTAAAEAAALGIPVIVSNECGVAEVVTAANAGLACAVDPISIRSALTTLQDRAAQLADERAARVARVLALVNLEEIARQQAEIYRSVMTFRPTPDLGRIPHRPEP